MKKKYTDGIMLLLIVLFILPIHFALNARPQTIAAWLFDEHLNVYPSSVLHDVGQNEYPLIIGRGGRIVPGKFGNALEITDPEPLDLPENAGSANFGLRRLPPPQGRSVEPLSWYNAHFAALITSGDNHLRKDVRHTPPTRTELNIGDFDWTIEFWFQPVKTDGTEGVIFEIGTGPRGENNRITRLVYKPEQNAFLFVNQAANAELFIQSDRDVLGSGNGQWGHYAFVYSAKECQIRHYVNGNLQSLPPAACIQALPVGEEDYFTVGRDGVWARPLPGRIDELRFSKGQRYTTKFTLPHSFKELYLPAPPEYKPVNGPPLLFTRERLGEPYVQLEGRKYLFIDDAIIDTYENINFTVNPPVVGECVIEVEGSFRKHVTIIEDEDGMIRLYTALENDYLGVFISEDGINFTAPDLGPEYKGKRNIVIPEPVGTGTVLIEPNAPPEIRWKYISDYHRQGLYVYTSPDGFSFKRWPQAVLPFRSGSQNDIFYDDQRQIYVGYHRTDIGRTPAGRTLRMFVLTETKNLLDPWPFNPMSPERSKAIAETVPIQELQPWYLDNGPLTPCNFGVEYPIIFAPDYSVDPLTMGVYNPKAIKYPWAPDTYLAFPIFYFHYYEGDPGRQILFTRRGGGPTETQFASSRDGTHWKRLPRPTYVGIGKYDDIDFVQTFIAQGMIRRGDEIWQYVFLDGDYHGPRPDTVERSQVRRVYRLIQRLDGFVSADAPYDTYGTIITRPLRFTGSRLVLNIDTDAHGYALVGFLDENGNPIEGYSIEDAVFINGNHIEIEAEWITDTRDNRIDDTKIAVSGDVSSLNGKDVRVIIKMRGAKLYSMQFKSD
jgi:hypothetical protein